MELIKRYANGMNAYGLTNEDAYTICRRLNVETWMANQMINNFGSYRTASNVIDMLVRDSDKMLGLIAEGKVEEAQAKVNDYAIYVKTFNKAFDGNIAIFNVDEYLAEKEAKKNMATERQVSYLSYLLKKANRTMGLTCLTKEEASQLISELKGE